jgi:hypothetical protein
MPSVADYLIEGGYESVSAYVIDSSAGPFAGQVFASTIGNPNIIKFDTGATVSGFSVAGHKILEQGTDSLPPGPYAKNPQRFDEQPTTFIVMSASVPPGTQARNPGAPWANLPYQESLVTNQTIANYLTFTRGYRTTNAYAVGIQALGDDSVDNSIQNQRAWLYQHGLTGSQGYKYGIQGILPKFSSVIFRDDRYGQFRDMLEQRKFGTFFDPVGVAPDGQLTGKKGLRSSPVQVRFKASGIQGFVSGSEKGIVGSSNRSSAATSSLPYDDGNFSNWSSVF